MEAILALENGQWFRGKAAGAVHVPRGSLESFEATLTPDALNGALTLVGSHTAQVILRLPKFSITTRLGQLVTLRADGERIDDTAAQSRAERGLGDVLLAWAYVGLRIVHSLWQAMVNRLPVRIALFFVSSVILVVLACRAAMLTLLAA